jgi:hypothetical protein
MAANLAAVYVNDTRVVLQGDPKPAAAKVLTAFGKKPEQYQLLMLESQADDSGRALNPDEIIDRTAQAGDAVYLKCVDSNVPASARGRGQRRNPAPAPQEPTHEGPMAGEEEGSTPPAEGGPQFESPAEEEPTEP